MSDWKRLLAPGVAEDEAALVELGRALHRRGYMPRAEEIVVEPPFQRYVIVYSSATQVGDYYSGMCLTPVEEAEITAALSRRGRPRLLNRATQTQGEVDILVRHVVVVCGAEVLRENFTTGLLRKLWTEVSRYGFETRTSEAGVVQWRASLESSLEDVPPVYTEWESVTHVSEQGLHVQEDRVRVGMRVAVQQALETRGVYVS